VHMYLNDIYYDAYVTLYRVKIRYFLRDVEDMSAHVFKCITTVCVRAIVREGLIKNVSSEIHAVYNVIVTEGKTL
jgi:hypothetical protein